MKLKLILTMLTSVVLSLPGYGSEKTKAVVHHDINQILVNHNFQGTALITNNSSPIHHKGYGFAVKEWHIPNRPSTRFRIASISKTFTAVLIMMLVENGTLNLDACLKSYLPNYPAEYADKMTVRHLLLHRSGISRQFKIPGWKSGKSLLPITKTEFLAMIAQMPLEFELDSKRHYSSANYYLLGAVIESVTGKAFGTVLRERILEPLQMNNSDIYTTGQIVPKLANAYKPVAGKYSFCPPVSGDYCLGGNVNMELYIASGSMYSTTLDLSIWNQALTSNRLLNKESRAFLFSNKTHAAWNVTEVMFNEEQRIQIAISDGGLEGYSSVMVRFSDEKLNVILLNNTGESYQKLIEIVLEIAELDLAD